MPRGYAKIGVLAVALVILVIEGFFVYRWYDRYSNYSSASGATVNGEASSQETAESTSGPETTQAAGDSGEPASGVSFVHSATDENSRGDYTYISHPSIDGDPNAVVLATPSSGQNSAADQYGEGSAAYEHNVGVRYEFADMKKWAIFNQDRTPVPAGTAFDVRIPPTSETFVHRAEPANTVGNRTYLDDPLTNSKPDAQLSVTQNWNPGGGSGVYNDHPVGVQYDEDVGKWAIYNRDGAPIPGRAAFNIAVS